MDQWSSPIRLGDDYRLLNNARCPCAWSIFVYVGFDSSYGRRYGRRRERTNGKVSSCSQVFATFDRIFFSASTSWIVYLLVRFERIHVTTIFDCKSILQSKSTRD